MSAVSERVAEQMRANGCFVVMWLDGWILDQVGDMVKVKRDHPLNRMRAIFSHLERCHMFEKRRIRGVDSQCRERVVRGFRLKDQYHTKEAK